MSTTDQRKAKRSQAVERAQAGEEARGRGRPSEYDPAFCDVVIAAGKAGKSKAEIAAELCVTRSTLDIWGKTHPEFSDALQEAHDHSLAWWEAIARKNVDQGAKVNASLWSRSMSGRFPTEPYRDRHELSGPNGGPVETHDVGAEVATLPKDKRDALRLAIAKVLNDGDKE